MPKISSYPLVLFLLLAHLFPLPTDHSLKQPLPLILVPSFHYLLSLVSPAAPLLLTKPLFFVHLFCGLPVPKAHCSRWLLCAPASLPPLIPAVSGVSRFLCVAQVLNGFRRFLCVARVLNGLCVVQVASSKLAGAHRRTWREGGAQGRG